MEVSSPPSATDVIRGVFSTSKGLEEDQVDNIINIIRDVLINDRPSCSSSCVSFLNSPTEPDAPPTFWFLLSSSGIIEHISECQHAIGIATPSSLLTTSIYLYISAKDHHLIPAILKSGPSTSMICRIHINTENEKEAPFDVTFAKLSTRQVTHNSEAEDRFVSICVARRVRRLQSPRIPIDNYAMQQRLHPYDTVNVVYTGDQLSQLCSTVFSEETGNQIDIDPKSKLKKPRKSRAKKAKEPEKDSVIKQLLTSPSSSFDPSATQPKRPPPRVPYPEYSRMETQGGQPQLMYQTPSMQPTSYMNNMPYQAQHNQSSSYMQPSMCADFAMQSQNQMNNSQWMQQEQYYQQQQAAYVSSVPVKNLKRKPSGGAERAPKMPYGQPHLYAYQSDGVDGMVPTGPCDEYMPAMGNHLNPFRYQQNGGNPAYWAPGQGRPPSRSEMVRMELRNSSSQTTGMLRQDSLFIILKSIDTRSERFMDSALLNRLLRCCSGLYITIEASRSRFQYNLRTYSSFNRTLTIPVLKMYLHKLNFSKDYVHFECIFPCRTRYLNKAMTQSLQALAEQFSCQSFYLENFVVQDDAIRHLCFLDMSYQAEIDFHDCYFAEDEDFYYFMNPINITYS